MLANSVSFHLSSVPDRGRVARHELLFLPLPLRRLVRARVTGKSVLATGSMLRLFPPGSAAHTKEHHVNIFRQHGTVVIRARSFDRAGQEQGNKLRQFTMSSHCGCNCANRARTEGKERGREVWRCTDEKPDALIMQLCFAVALFMAGSDREAKPPLERLIALPIFGGPSGAALRFWCRS